jgi:hypothetical protein
VFRVILLSILLITTFYGSTKTIDKKIKNNKKSLKNTSVIKKHTATKIKSVWCLPERVTLNIDIIKPFLSNKNKKILC